MTRAEAATIGSTADVTADAAAARSALQAARDAMGEDASASFPPSVGGAMGAAGSGSSQFAT